MLFQMKKQPLYALYDQMCTKVPYSHFLQGNTSCICSLIIPIPLSPKENKVKNTFGSLGSECPCLCNAFVVRVFAHDLDFNLVPEDRT